MKMYVLPKAVPCKLLVINAHEKVRVRPNRSEAIAKYAEDTITDTFLPFQSAKIPHKKLKK